MRIVTFGDNEFSNMWLFLKDAVLHPFDPAIYVKEEDLDVILPKFEPETPETVASRIAALPPLEKDIREVFAQFISVYCPDHILKQTNSFLMEGRVWRLFDSVMNRIERNDQMNNVEMLQDNLFNKELEYVKLQLSQPSNDPDYVMPVDRKLHYGVPFFVSNRERLMVVKNYLEERINQWNTPSETNQLER